MQWPSGASFDADLTATAHTVRFSGPDRFQTNLATALALRGFGDFPFDSPDRTGSGATGLAQADHWWGARTCPRAVLVVAGDTFADALAAASLSDPTNSSNEPRVQRVAAADPLFDPVGGFDRVDTDAAPIIVTASARDGGTSLTPSARVALRDLAAGGCVTAREAIIVGGEGAVAPSVASELVSLGYDEVFRVAGADRYETAVAVAQALGTGPGVVGDDCIDPTVADGDARQGFYGNAVVEFRFTADSCRLLGRSVVLADGDTGADALAAGWWTSFWQVPILLTGPDGSLPPATEAALQTLEIDNLIVLGGTGRIPEETVVEAGRLAGAAVGRIAGVDRYATSAAMARAFGGWWPGQAPGSLVCLAASGGSGATAVGWPDALAAGPWCARASGAAAAVGAPARALPPIHDPNATTHDVGGVRPSRDTMPILLTRPGASTLPEPVERLLQDVFRPESNWCNAGVTSTRCLPPGFGVVFGGTGVVAEAAAVRLAHLVSGGRYVGAEDVTPTAALAFPTRLDLSPVYATFGTGFTTTVCFPGGAVSGVRWLTAWASSERRDLLHVGELGSDDYDAGVSLPRCLGVGAAESVWVDGVSLSGHATPGHAFDLRDSERLELTAPIQQTGTLVEAGATIRWVFEGPPETPTWLVTRGSSNEVDLATLDLELSPTGTKGTFSADVTLQTAIADIAATARGDAVLVGDVWELAGRISFAGSATDVQRALGGLRVSIDMVADTASWDLDGVILQDR